MARVDVTMAWPATSWAASKTTASGEKNAVLDHIFAVSGSTNNMYAQQQQLMA
jgi:hypothetical protein